MGRVYLIQYKFDEAWKECIESIRLKSEDNPVALVCQGIIARTSGLAESNKYFICALEQSDTISVDQAIALLCLERKNEALQVLKQALAQLKPVRILEHTLRCSLLKTAPVPPNGIDEIIALLKETQAKWGL